MHFKAVQNSNKGANGNVVFWLNVKTNGAYAGAHLFFIIGEGASEFKGLGNSMRAELHGNMGVSNGKVRVVSDFLM